MMALINTIKNSEWYKVDDSTTHTILEAEHKISPTPTDGATINSVNTGTNTNIDDVVTNANAIAIINSPIANNTSLNKVNFAGGSLAKVYDNQRLIIRSRVGSDTLIVVANGEQSKGSTVGINVGSTLSALVGDLTNVITGGGTPGGSNKEVQFNDSGAFGAEAGFEYDKTTDFLNADNIEGRHYGENTGFRTQTVGTAFKYMLAPSDFSVSANLSANIYTRNSGGSVQPDSNGARDNSIFAMVFLPIGYRITGFRVTTSSSLSVSLTKGDISNTTITNIFTGTSNSGNSLTTTETIAVNKYYLLKVGTSATSDAIYGGEFSLEKI